LEGRVLTPRIGGIGRYARHLIEALLSLAAQRCPDLEFVIFTAPQNRSGYIEEYRGQRL
jgi:hypothetical protein